MTKKNSIWHLSSFFKNQYVLHECIWLPWLDWIQDILAFFFPEGAQSRRRFYTTRFSDGYGVKKPKESQWFLDFFEFSKIRKKILNFKPNILETKVARQLFFLIISDHIRSIEKSVFSFLTTISISLKVW